MRMEHERDQDDRKPRERVEEDDRADQLHARADRLRERGRLHLQERRDQRRDRGQERHLRGTGAERDAVGDEIGLAHAEHERREETVKQGILEGLANGAGLQINRSISRSISGLNPLYIFTIVPSGARTWFDGTPVTPNERTACMSSSSSTV